MKTKRPTMTMKVSDIRCSVCNVGPIENRNLYRDDQTREWRCWQHVSVEPDSGTCDLVKIIGPEPLPPNVKPVKAWDNAGCAFAGPGRGDCLHFIGFPSPIHKPGQHDGPDDTVDAYGKPNGWCWACWKDFRLTEASQYKYRFIMLCTVLDTWLPEIEKMAEQIIDPSNNVLRKMATDIRQAMEEKIEAIH